MASVDAAVNHGHVDADGIRAGVGRAADPQPPERFHLGDRLGGWGFLEFPGQGDEVNARVSSEAGRDGCRHGGGVPAHGSPVDRGNGKTVAALLCRGRCAGVNNAVLEHHDVALFLLGAG